MYRWAITLDLGEKIAMSLCQKAYPRRLAEGATALGKEKRGKTVCLGSWLAEV